MYTKSKRSASKDRGSVKSRRSSPPSRTDSYESRGSSKSRRDPVRDNSPRRRHHNSSSDKKSYHHHPYPRKSRASSPQHHETIGDKSSKKTRPISSSSSTNNQAANGAKNVEKCEKGEKDLVGSESEGADMLKLMGFGNFNTTKGKQVPGNNVSAVHVIHKRKYRQYMNRKGGFNRPLDFVA